MYNIENKSDIFVKLNDGEIFYIGSEQDLIKYLARGFRVYDIYLDNYTEQCYNVIMGYKNSRFSEYFFNYNDRRINGYDYKQEAWEYYRKFYKDKTEYHYWRRNKIYKGIFRRTPVAHTGKIGSGGPWVKPRRIKHLKAMYNNPEYKEFNRGSKKELPAGRWDDWHRYRERNWKSQGKRKHQWKGDVNM